VLAVYSARHTAELVCSFRLNPHGGANAHSEATYERQANAYGEATLTAKLNACGKTIATMLGLRV